MPASRRHSEQASWVFGYGSLIWRPGFHYSRRCLATLPGWRRVFWQGSHDHRGTVDAPGRVVTLIPDPDSSCVGMLYLLDADTIASTFETLDHREKNGYERVEAQFSIAEGSVSGIVYIANEHNEAYLGEAPAETIAAQIVSSSGPSGDNIDYLYALAEALRELDVHDEHVFAIEKIARRLRSSD